MLSSLKLLCQRLRSSYSKNKPVRTTQFVVPRLEALEPRLVLDAMVFTAVGTPSAPALWNLASNWTDLSVPTNIHIPTANDDVGIPSSAGTVEISGQNADINSIVTQGGTNLIIDSGIELKINSNPPTNPPAGMPTSPTPGHNSFGGFVTDPGRINLNTTNVLTGTIADFTGGTLIGPGDLNGNLMAGPVSAFNFYGSGAGNTFASGATLGMDAGNINVLSPVSIQGTLNDMTTTMNVMIGGDLTGPGALNEQVILNWTGGTISLTGGVDVDVSGQLNVSGSNGKILSTSLSLENSGSTIGGTVGLTMMS
jgi:hypothetical protein